LRFGDFPEIYPNVRYFSFVVYKGESPVVGIAGDLYDAQIAPDPGSINPFVKPGGSNGKYTVVISRIGRTSGNTIGVSPEDFVWVFLRMYVPSADPSLSGESLIGGVPLPAIVLTANGVSQELSQCSPVNDLRDMSAYLQRYLPRGRFDGGLRRFIPVVPLLEFQLPESIIMSGMPCKTYDLPVKVRSWEFGSSPT
jgi:hypothetical protein